MNTNAQESSTHPGYYLIPGYSRYVISPYGVVLNVESGNYLQGGTNPAGYHILRLVDDNGKTLTWGRHRLMGFVFKHPNEAIDDLQVNHENGIKGDDRLDNLEWMTRRGNIEHAGAMGLSEKCIPISVRNHATGEVKYFPSMIAAANELGLSKDAIAWRCGIGEKRLFLEGLQYRIGHSKDPWHEFTSPTAALLENTTSKAVLARDVRTGNVFEYPQVTLAAKALGVAVSTLSQWLCRPDQPVVANGRQVKWAAEMTAWREPNDLQAELDGYGGRRKVIVTEACTGKRLTYSSAVECAEAHGLNPTTLNERLKSNGKKVFRDGYTYKYG